MPTCDYLGMPNPPTPPTTPHANVASGVDVGAYDARLAHEIAQRDLAYATRQRERDARERAYLDALSWAPVTTALRERRNVPLASQRAFMPTPPRPHRDWADAPCPTHGPGCKRCARPARGAPMPSAWEANAPHARTHMAPDPSCHHPLVKCSHKW